MQAVIVAGLVVGRAVVRDMVSNEAAASMIGYVTMGMALVPMIAPFIGGTLDEAFRLAGELLVSCGDGRRLPCTLLDRYGRDSPTPDREFPAIKFVAILNSCAPKGSGATVLARPLPQARSSPISAARPLSRQAYTG